MYVELDEEWPLLVQLPSWKCQVVNGERRGYLDENFSPSW